MTQYQVNPKRGCGTKVPGGFYAEAEMGATGTMHAITWVLGSGVEGGENCLARIPARQLVFGDPAATLISGEFVSSETPIAGFWSEQGLEGTIELYNKMSDQCGGKEALFDHVGSNSYTPGSFAEELAELGPSRRIPQDVAKMLVDNLPIPIYFTHAEVPLFASEEDRDLFIELMLKEGAEVDLLPTWFRDEWGLWAHMDNGNEHYMIGVLYIADKLKKSETLQASNEHYAELGAILDRARFVEQTFAASWITKVSYAAKHDDPGDKLSGIRQSGIDILDIGDTAE